MEAAPSAELIKIKEDSQLQMDEIEMGMTYKELETFSLLRTVFREGPYSMFGHLKILWPDLTSDQVG